MTDKEGTMAEKTEGNRGLTRVVEAAERLDTRQRLSVGLTDGMIREARDALAQQDQEGSGVGEADREQLKNACAYLEAQRDNAEAAGAYGAGNAMRLAEYARAIRAVLAATPPPALSEQGEAGK